MDFTEANQEYQLLIEQYLLKQIDQAEFDSKLNLLKVTDEQGQLWQIDNNGKWYLNEGQPLPNAAPPLDQAQPPIQPPPIQQPPILQPVPVPPAAGAPLKEVKTSPKKSSWRIVAIIGAVLILCVCLGLAALIIYGNSLPPSNQAKPSATSKPSQAIPTKIILATPNESEATLSSQPTPTIQPNRPVTANGLMAKGPWLLFSTDKGFLYAANPDGSMVTQVSKDTFIAPYDLSSSLSPDGIHLALITASDSQGLHGLVLHILTLPEGQEVKAIPLTDPKTEPGPDAAPGDPSFEAIRAMTQQENSVAWSPDGRTLAFIGFMTGPSADLYSYSLDQDKVVHLSGGPSQAYYPLWSPDGKYILHFGVTTFGTGAGYTTSGMWAARANNSSVITLPNPTGGGDTVVGWTDAHTFLVYSFNITCGPNNLRTVNIETLKVTTLINKCFYSVAFDPKSGAILYTSSNVDTSDTTVIPAGTYFLAKGQQNAQKIAENAAADASWNKDGSLFFVKEDNTLVAYDAQGSSVMVPKLDGNFQPAISRSNPLLGPWIWINNAAPNSQLFVGAKEQKTIQVDQGTLSYPTWSPDDSRIFYFSPEGLHTAIGPEFKPKLITFAVDGKVDSLIWAGLP